MKYFLALPPTFYLFLGIFCVLRMRGEISRTRHFPKKMIVTNCIKFEECTQRPSERMLIYVIRYFYLIRRTKFFSHPFLNTHVLSEECKSTLAYEWQKNDIRKARCGRQRAWYENRGGEWGGVCRKGGVWLVAETRGFPHSPRFSPPRKNLHFTFSPRGVRILLGVFFNGSVCYFLCNASWWVVDQFAFGILLSLPLITFLWILYLRSNH